jgi:4-hydroxybenzoate polyprenyltransferase
MPLRASTPRLLHGLVLACHPLPTVAVTAFATAFAAAVGLPAGRVALVALAVLLGQLSIGWCNDWVDAPRDVAAGRRDKPAVTGLVPPRLLAAAAVAALVACAAASPTLGVRAAGAHALTVLGGWTYDLWLKPTAASFVPYAVAFGALPAVATLAAAVPRLPEPGVMAGGALLGLAAHFTNTVGDTEADAATGVRGLPQRLGAAVSLRVSAVLVVLAAVALLTAARGAGAPALTVLVAGALVGAAGVVLGGDLRARGRFAFRLTLAAVALVIAGFLLSA